MANSETPAQCGLIRPCKIALCYVYPQLGDVWDLQAAAFLRTYARFPASIPHSLYVLANGSRISRKYDPLFKSIPHFRIQHDNIGKDIGAYQKAVRLIECDLMVCLGSHARIVHGRWLERIRESFEARGFGLYGNSASLLPLPHIRTTVFWMPPDLLSSYPYRINSNRLRYPFEHGENSLTSWAFHIGSSAWQVTAKGEFAKPDWGRSPTGCCNGDKRECLFTDRLVDMYATRK